MNSETSTALPVPSAELVAALLRDGLPVRLRLTGWSMKPLLPSGVVVEFRSTPAPMVGDVVLVRHGEDKLVAHRVIAADAELLWTKGDACLTADAPVSRESLLGCAVRVEGRALPVPLRSRWLRILGLGINRFYPKLVFAYRRIVPRKVRVETGGVAARC